MDTHQVAFIICTNNEQYYEECVRYIQDLEVPEHYSIDILCIQDADSMTQGYNAGMLASDAKYKVYLHHDTFILNKNFIYDILRIFESDENIGMIGVLGARELPFNACCYSNWDMGASYAYDGIRMLDIVYYQDREKPCIPVKAIDGMIMITQIDIPWREDFLDGWDFYDVSQSLEMKGHGYQTVVPYQEAAWCYHDCGVSKLEKYDFYRHKMIKEYPQYFKEEKADVDSEEKKQRRMKEALAMRSRMIKLISLGAYDELCSIVNHMRELMIEDTQIQEIVNLMEIYSLEKASRQGLFSEWWLLKDWEQIYEYYRWVRFTLLRIGFQRADDRADELRSLLKERRISKDAIRNISYSTFGSIDNIYPYLLKEEYDEPLVSVIVPVYNGEDFVAETIVSILNQTYQNMEIIVIDDASTDNSRKVISSFSDSRIRIIYCEKNQNVCYAGNIGFKEAKGKYVALIGHDDLWVPDKLEKQIAFLEEHPSYSVCFTWADIINENGDVINEKEENLYKRFHVANEPTSRLIRKLFLYNNFFCAPSACIRKEFLDKVGEYRYGLLQLQDYDLWLRLLMLGSAFILCEELTYYRRFEKEGKNISAVNKKTFNRTFHEEQYIKDAWLNQLTTEQFLEIFDKDKRNPSACSEKEVLCEKAFLLWKYKNCFSIKRFIELLEDEECRKILSEEYHFELQDFYKMNAETMSFDGDN